MLSSRYSSLLVLFWLLIQDSELCLDKQFLSTLEGLSPPRSI